MKRNARPELFRMLPAVDEVLHLPAIEALVVREGRAVVTAAARTVLSRIRNEIAAGRLDEEKASIALAGLPPAIERQVRWALSDSLRPVVNATGVVLHTNLGRAPLIASAVEHIRRAATAYSNLEFNLETGERGKRDVHVDRLFERLLDIPGVSTIVVNNNAAAVLLALNALAEGGEVIVSRGELVEIGGSFRIPEIMAKSGAVLREVGSTNRTRLADYERAVSERTRLLLRVHRSNFQMVGFTGQPTLEELVELGRKRGIPVMEDLGSGALFDLRMVGIAGEPSVVDSLRAGVNVVTYSGDKLLGGPQAGMLSGRQELIARIRSNPLFRALRVDKLTYAALEATLLAYLRQDLDAIPAIRMLRLSVADIERRGRAILESLPAGSLAADLIEGESVPGGGSAPAAFLPSKLLAISCQGYTAGELAARLRSGDPPVVARVEEERVLLDLRTVFPEQDRIIVDALGSIVQKSRT